MSNDRSPRYDSFVVRVWHETATGRLLRAEVDHVQSGAVYIARDIGFAWIQDALQKALSAKAEDADPAVLPLPPAAAGAREPGG